MEEVTNVHKIEAKVIKSHSEQVLTDLLCFWMLRELLSLWPVLKIMKSSQVVKLLFPKRTFASAHVFNMLLQQRCSYFKSCSSPRDGNCHCPPVPVGQVGQQL